MILFNKNIDEDYAIMTKLLAVALFQSIVLIGCDPNISN